ncbi:hypothetical protein ACIGO8_30920 [Streptomyces sp. NPDC053493]|uniref:hypothetical protein n=1 Tax=Streptomyces sp. NPDC053493 TaxID=3365705 RepID=UPI0037CECB32
MPDSTFAKVRSDVLAGPAAERLKEELRRYLRARAEHTVTRLGARLGESVARLGQPGASSGGGRKGLAKSRQALADGRSPAQAVVAGAVTYLKEGVKGKVKGLVGNGRTSADGAAAGGMSRSVTIVEDIDVGVPVREAYDEWIRFQKSVEEAEVTEQVPGERIAWTTEGAKGTVTGVVTFHALTDDLTRVLLVLEKTGGLWRAQGRRARLDLKRYRTFVTMRGADGEEPHAHDRAAG